MFRRHFFLVAALVVLLLMVVAGGFKLATREKGPGGPGGPGGGMAMQGGGGAPGGGAARQGKRGGMGGGFGGPAQVSAAVVRPRAFTDALQVLGVAKGRRSVTITAAATQLVERVRFADGQAVAAGAVLVELRDTEQSAGVAQAQARLAEAQRAYERYRTLGEKGFASKAQIDQYESAYRSAQADVRAARARESDRLIRAPFAGVVGLSDVAPGALVNPGAPIVTLDDLSTIRVDFQVPERYLSQVSEGQVITAEVDAFPGETITGRIANLDTRIDERTRAITARGDFPNPGRRLKPGMMIRVSLARGDRVSMAAPESAVSVQGNSTFVYVIRQVGDRTTTEQRPVVTGIRQAGFVEIRDGVQAGERIVADGLNKVQPGMPVRVVGAGGPGGGAAPAGKGPAVKGAAAPGAPPSKAMGGAPPAQRTAP